MAEITPGRYKSESLLPNVSFHLLWSSTLASGMGDRLAMLAALTLLGYGKQGADESTIQAGIEFFFFLPYLLWSPIAGWLADRLPRKWLMFTADESRGLMVLCALALVPAVGSLPGAGVLPGAGAGLDIYQTWFHVDLFGVSVTATHAWKVWGLLFFIGMMAATFVPAKLSIVPNVVGYKNLQRANAMVVLTGVIGSLLGFFVGGHLVENSVRTVIFISAMCYCVSGCFWIFLKTPWQTADGHTAMRFKQVFNEIVDGLRYAWKHKTVKVLIFAAAVLWTGTSIYSPALAVINVEMYGGAEGSYSLLMGFVGLGMLIGAVFIGVVNARRGVEVLLTTGMIGCGISIGLQVLVPNFGFGLVVALFTGISASIILVPLNTLLQRITADHIRGRVFAAKEVLTEFGKVGISAAIWQIPNTDPVMRPLTFGLGILLLIIAGYGLWRYVASSPSANPVQNILWRLIRLYTYSFHRLKISGAARVPTSGPVLIVSNHTAGIDPMLIQTPSLRLVRFMMAAEYQSRLLGWFWKLIKVIGVKRDGNDRTAVRNAVGALGDGDIVCIFPEGGLPKEPVDGLRKFHSGVGLIAKRSGAKILPVYISGTPHCSSTFGSFFTPSRSRIVLGQPLTAKQLVQKATQRDQVSGKPKTRYDLTELIRMEIEQLKNIT